MFSLPRRYASSVSELGLFQNCTFMDNAGSWGTIQTDNDGGNEFNVKVQNCIIRNTDSVKGVLYEMSSLSNYDILPMNCLFLGNTNGDIFDEEATIYTGATDINANVTGASSNVDGASPLFVMETDEAVSGTLSVAGAYNATTHRTVLTTTSGGLTPNAYVNELIKPDSSERRHALIESNDATTFTVFGDVSGVAGAGDTWVIANYQLRLRISNRAIDAGASYTGVPTTDFDGNPRLVGSQYDIGAFESETPQPVATIFKFR